MKRHLFFFKLLLLSFGLLLPLGSLQAQSPGNAEFHLDLHFRDTTTDGTIDSVPGRAFGYDPAATDTFSKYDATEFGELPDYPGNLGPGNDFWFTRFDQTDSTPPTETTVDIRHKPTTDSFALSFSMGLAFENYPGSIFWDPSQIPSEIKGIWLRPHYDTAIDVPPLLDMKTTNIFTVPNPSQAELWGNFIVTIFYNMQPRYIPPAAVNGPSSNGAGLIARATVYPDPMPAGGALDVTLGDAAALTIVGYDITGREVLRMSRQGMGGENILDLSPALANVHGAVMLHIEAANAARNETKNVMLVRE